MNVTPKDILEKEFSKKMNGYDPEQVDEFLDEIIKQFESLMEENEDIIARNESLKNEVARLRQKADKAEDVEEKMMATVLVAQKNAALYVEKAEEQARRITEIANQNAKTVIESVHLRMEVVQQDLRKYEKVVVDYRRRFKTFLEEQARFMDAHLIDSEELGASAAEVTRSISSLTQQMREMDGDAEATNTYLSDVLKQSNEPERDFGQSTANLQKIVNDVIRD